MTIGKVHNKVNKLRELKGNSEKLNNAKIIRINIKSNSSQIAGLKVAYNFRIWIIKLLLILLSLYYFMELLNECGWDKI